MASPLVVELEISIEDKRAALQFALDSDCLSRSDRLKSLLSYLCEAEFADAHHRLTEYDIAVSALGRRSNFSPIEDSTVRSRTYELRQKLERLYSHEAPQYPIRIDIPKGNYRPKFQRIRPPEVTQDRQIMVDPEFAHPIPEPKEQTRSDLRRSAPAFFAGVLLTLGVCFSVWWINGRENMRSLSRDRGQLGHSEIAELWTPFFSSARPILVTFETRLFVTVGPLILRDPNIENMHDVESSEPLMQVKKLFHSPQIYEARRYADFGAANAMFSISQLMATQGVQAKAQRSADLTDEEVRSDNLILLGKPGAYDGIRMALPKSPNFAFESNIALKNLHPLPGEPSVYNKLEDTAASGGMMREYGLITMTHGAEKGQSILYIEAAESELFWPLALYLTQPDHVRELAAHLRLASGKLPEAYEVVVKAEFQARGPVNISYVTHRVLSNSDK